MDLDGLGRTGRFVFVDGLTGLFADAAGEEDGDESGSRRRSSRRRRVLRGGGGLEDVRREVEGALGDLTTSRKVLVLDQPDVLLATSPSSSTLTSQALQTTILQLRSVRPPFPPCPSRVFQFTIHTLARTHSPSLMPNTC